MKELLDKFYAGTATPEEEAQLLRSADSLPEGPDRELLQGLAAMRRQAAISRLIDEAAAEEAAPRRRIVWPYWVGALAMAACILLMLLPREAMPVQVAENKEVKELRRPAVETRPASSQPQDGNVAAETGQAPSLQEIEFDAPVETRPASSPLQEDTVEEETGQAPSLLGEELLYAEAEPLVPEEEEEIIVLSAPSLIAHANSTTLIADATPVEASNAPLSTPHSPLSISLFGQTLGDPDVDPFGRRPIFGN